MSKEKHSENGNGNGHGNYRVHSKFAAIIKGKCPQCRQGDLFKRPITDIRNFEKLNDECPVCGADFVIEPGFYWGAMYVSYALNVAIIVPMVLLYVMFFFDVSEIVFVAVLVTMLLLFIPVNSRLARSLMLHWFGPHRFDPSKGAPKKLKELEVDFRKRREAPGS